MNNNCCQSCQSTKFKYDIESELYICTNCGLVIDEVQFFDQHNSEEDQGNSNYSLTPAEQKGLKQVKSPSRKPKYAELLLRMKDGFQATMEEYKYGQQLLQLYLNDERKVYEYAYTEVILCIYYLIKLYSTGNTLNHYCQLFSVQFTKCLKIYNQMKLIFGSKVSTEHHHDHLFYLLDQLMISCYPHLMQKKDWYTTFNKRNSKKMNMVKDEKENSTHWTLEDQKIIKQQTITLMTLLRRHSYFDGRIAGPIITLCLAMTVLHYKIQYQLKQQPEKSTPPFSSSSLFKVKGLAYNRLAEYSLSKPGTLQSRYLELVNILSFFGKALPWVKPSLKHAFDFIYHLDDILTSIEHLEQLSLPSSLLCQQQQQQDDQESIAVIDKLKQQKRKYQLDKEEIDEEKEKNTHDKLSSPSLTTTSLREKNKNDINNPSLPSLSILNPISFQKSIHQHKKRKLQIEKIKNKQMDNDDDSTLKIVDQLLKSKKWDLESIMAMSDHELISQAYRLSYQYPSHYPHLLDHQVLMEEDLSKEEADAYIIS
ncbi:hypothetical protein BJ944DRAFT_268434 [Cunninghamella echinulata]|nr:hypothetical protein BJ944DRAFT_268434 [Cunninghamella echinulata]